MTFAILAVCTGNICRSPLVERLLAMHLPDVVVASAGTGALVGEPMQPGSRTILERRGGDATGFEARAITSRMVADADLVLALTRRHRAAVVRLHPRATRYTFTLRELARIAATVGPLSGATPSERLHALVPAAAARRGFEPVLDPADDDVVDPYRRDQAVYDEMAAHVVPAVAALVDAVR